MLTAFYFTVKRCDGTWRRPLRKQSGGLFLGRAWMKVWLWTSHIGEDESLTYSNHRHSQVTVITNYNRKYDGTWGSLATAACGGKREQSAVWNKEHKAVHLCTTQGDYISDGGESDRKIKTDKRKQLFLGRALMIAWLWTGRIGEVVSLTYSNHRHSQLPLQQL